MFLHDVSVKAPEAVPEEISGGHGGAGHGAHACDGAGPSAQPMQAMAMGGAGALRDTVHVPPMSIVDGALDAGEAARWTLHCHHMPHLASGMTTEFAVAASV